MVSVIMHSSIFRGAMTGLSAAAFVDWRAFSTWKTWHDVESYDWGVATFRWVQGAAIGALSGLGFGALS